MRKPSQYTVICLSNEGYEASLEKQKIYVALSDNDAEKLGLARTIDESGEDHLYSLELFTQVELPPRVHRAVLAA